MLGLCYDSGKGAELFICKAEEAEGVDTKEIAMRWLSENLNYVDSVTVIDSTGRIIAKQRFNPRYTDEENLAHNQWALGKNLLELFPSLSPEDSTLLQVLHTGKIIYIENQEAWNLQGRKTVCNNLNFPIIFRGKIVGAVEISRDITHIDNRIHPVPPSQTPPAPRSAAARYSLTDIITQNSGMLRLKETIGKVANSTSSVLICGETGTGKELFAQAIHNDGPRRNRPFVAINCGAIPKELLESELFGYEEGAFTGAQKGGRPGKFELADTGTLFLDEIGDMPFDMQVKLLRVLQSGEIQRVGGLRTVPVDLRIISATNKDLKQAIAQHQFRADLYYRISTLSILVPPLRERAEDILPLAEHFIHRHELRLNRHPVPLPQETAEAILRYPWPGNIRQLESAVERAVHLAEGGALLPEHFGIADLMENRRPAAPAPAQATLEDIERQAIAAALVRFGGNISQTAFALGVSRPTLYRKMSKYGLEE